MTNTQDNTNKVKDERHEESTNFQTWIIGLWIDNDQKMYLYWRKQTARHIREAIHDEWVRDDIWTAHEAAQLNLARQLKEEIIRAAPDIDLSIYSDLLQTTLDSVNWFQLAENLLVDLVT